jgi:hypothetical protein
MGRSALTSDIAHGTSGDVEGPQRRMNRSDPHVDRGFCLLQRTAGCPRGPSRKVVHLVGAGDHAIVGVAVKRGESPTGSTLGD